MRQRRVTSTDVAQKAGVSRTTVSLVLNERGGSNIPEETRRRVRETAARLGYRPNASARALARGRTDVVGIVMYEAPGVHRIGPFFRRTLLEALLYAVLRSERNPMLYARLADGPADPQAYDDGRADAFLLLAPREEDALAGYLAERRQPFVAVARRPATGARASWVDADHEGGVAAAVAHLAEQGHTRIAHVMGSLANPTARLRRDAFAHEMRAQGLPFRQEYVRAAGWLPVRAEETVADLLSLPERPTAIFCANDEMAMGAYRAARRLGFTIPDDVSIVGFDDADFARDLDPPLTTVRYPIFPMADAAVEMIARFLLDPEDPLEPRVLPIEFVARGSVVPPRAEAHGAP